MKAGKLLLMLGAVVLVTSCQSLKQAKQPITEHKISLPSTTSEVVNVSDLGLTNLDVSCYTNLLGLYCGGNHLKHLDVSACTNIQDLQCWENRLIELNVSACARLEMLDCPQNQLTNLDVSACASLQYLTCDSNSLRILDISSNKTLTWVDARRNPLTNIVVWWNPPAISNKPSTLWYFHYDGSPTFTYSP